ncbi:uncharacterized protein [Haliotis asinina]|uniref:uncharacterized protein n=1 Tax=Haliotis asinina TaxID=109174 RepID=UPI003531A85A
MTTAALVYTLLARDVMLTTQSETFKTTSKLHCGQLCSSSSNCFSFFYHDTNRLCNLVDGIIRPGISATVQSTGFKYYSRPDPCIPPFIHFLDFNLCIKANVNKRNFEGARNSCQQYGGGLPILKDEFGLSFFITLVQGSGANTFIGGEEVAGVWRWLDGEAIPDMTKHIADKTCLEITRGGAMDPARCSIKKNYYCEIVMPTIAGAEY